MIIEEVEYAVNKEIDKNSMKGIDPRMTRKQQQKDSTISVPCTVRSLTVVGFLEHARNQPSKHSRRNKLN